MRHAFLALVLVACKPAGPPHAQYEQARAAVHKLSPAAGSAFGAAIDELEKTHATTIYVSVFADLKSTQDATEWLKTYASSYPDATVSTVFPFYASLLHPNTPGENLAVTELQKAFARLDPGGLLRFAAYDDKSTGPRINVNVLVKPVSVFPAPGGHRIYAALDCTYSASMHIGSTDTPLGGPVSAPAPDAFEVSRMVFKGEKAPALGAEPSIREDSLVYTSMVEHSSADAIPKLVSAIVPQGH